MNDERNQQVGDPMATFTSRIAQRGASVTNFDGYAKHMIIPSISMLKWIDKSLVGLVKM